MYKRQLVAVTAREASVGEPGGGSSSADADAEGAPSATAALAYDWDLDGAGPGTQTWTYVTDVRLVRSDQDDDAMPWQVVWSPTVVHPRLTDGAVLRTNDGGRSWKRYATGARGRISDLAFVSLNRGWALAADRSSSRSVILDTTDGGETWREDRIVEGELLRALAIFGETHAWAVGERPEHGEQVLMRYRAD